MPLDHSADIEISAFSWVPEFAQGLVRDLRVRWALEEAGLAYRVRLLDGNGERPEGLDTYYDYLVSLSFHEGAEFALNPRRCLEIDREFVQYYHRRICWLALKEYQRAAEDADHTLKLMDFSTAHSPDDNWSLMHEQYRPFVLFHRTQARALTELLWQTAIGLAPGDEALRSRGQEDLAKRR